MMPQQSLLQTLLLGCLALGAGILLGAPQSATAAPTQQKPPKVDALVIPINPAVFEIGQLRRGLLDAFAKESGALQNSNLDGQSSTKATATSSTEDDDDAEDEDEDVYEDGDDNDNEDGDEAPAGHQQQGGKSAPKKPKASLQGIVSFDCVHADRIANDLKIISSTLKKQDTLRAESAARRTSNFKAKAREDIIEVAKGHLQEEADQMRRQNEEIMKDLEAERHRQSGWKTSFLETSEEASKKKKNVVEKNVTKRLAGSLELLAKTVEHCLPQDRKSAAHGLGQLGQLGQVDPQLGFLQRLPGKLRGIAASLAAWEHQMDFKEREEYDHLQSSFDKDLKQEAEKELSPVREELRDLRVRHKQLAVQSADRLRALEAFSKEGDLFGESPTTPGKKKTTKKLVSSNSSKKANEGLPASSAPGSASPLMSNASNSSSNNTSSSKPENFTLDWETAIALNLHSSGATGEGPLKNDVSSGSKGSKVMKANNDDSHPDATWYLAEARKLRMGAEVAKQANREKKAVTLDKSGAKRSDVTKKHHAFHWQSNPEIQAYLRGRSEKKSASLIAIRPEREEVILEREKVLLKREDALLAKETHV